MTAGQSRAYGIMVMIIALASLFTVPDIQAVMDHGPAMTLGAHRGNSVKYMENTLEAIESAVNDDRYAFIELDIQYTKDKQIVVFHDNKLFRFQKQLFAIKNLTYEQLQLVSRIPIPLYGEVMDIIGTKKKVNIEIKSQGNPEEDRMLVDEIIHDAEKRGILPQVILSSISREVVMYIATAYPGLPVGQIFFITPATYFPGDLLVQQFYRTVKETGATYVLLHGINLRNYESFLRLKPDGLTLVFWHFDDTMYVVGDVW